MNTLKTTMLMATLTVLFVLVGNALGGQGGMMPAFILACAMNLGTYWFSDRIVLRMYREKEATQEEAPRLYELVKELVLKADLHMPRIYIIPGETPNAFATGRNPSHVGVTERIRCLNTWALRR